MARDDSNPVPGMRLALAALALALLLTGLLALSPILCPDVWWHLKTGEVILSEGRVPTTDSFTYTATGRPWVTHEWLAEVALFGLYNLGGIDLLVVLQALLAMAAVGLGAAAGLAGVRMRERLPAVALGVLLAGPLIAPRAFARPHMFTAVFLGLTLLLLRKEAATGRRAWRLALVPLFLLWANVHSGFTIGLALIVLYWAGEALGRRYDLAAPAVPAHWRARGIALALAAVATLANPNGIEAALYPVRLLARAEVRSSIVELRSVFHPAYRGALFLKVLLLAALVLTAAIWRSRRRLDPALLLPGLVFGFLALRTVRGLSEFSILVPALIGVHGEWLARHRRAARIACAAVGLLAIGAGAADIRWGVPMGSDAPRRVGLGADPANLPEAAARFLTETRPAGRVFNMLGHGGYFIYALWPQQQVYVDGRLDVFPRGFLDAYGRLLRTGAGWDEACAKYGITLAVLDYPDDPSRVEGLSGRLRRDPQWACVYFGDNVIVYAQRVPENDALIARFGCPFDPAQRAVGSIWAFAASAPADTRAQALSAIAAMLEVTPREKTLLIASGVLLDATGRSAEGAARLGEAVSVDPADTGTRILLAGALRRAGDSSAARREIERVMRNAPRSVDALIVKADIERNAGDLAGAVATLTRASALDPRNATIELCLGLVLDQQGNPVQAEQHFRRALALRPGDATALRELEKLRPR
jgi:Flp pilus assembly protein TadD